MNYNRLVIDTIKQTFSDYVSSADFNPEALTETLNKLDMEIDRLTVANEPVEEITQLKEDIAWLKYDLFEA